MESLSLITVELTKVYRQQDQKFIEILNALRNRNIKEIDFQSLNKRYCPNFEPKDSGYVYLTSHHRMADEINQKQLLNLKSDSFFYTANIFGSFNESQYPTDPVLELREGAQVMFIRNDTGGDKKYYNGKLATVLHLYKTEIWVKFENSGGKYRLRKELWENKTYRVDGRNNIKEEVIGSFEQYPVRLAWAVTIHKSQGLTFDKLVIDAGSSFASGQVYVALSRCRTLEGIVLKSRISPESIIKDERIEAFQKSTDAKENLSEIIEEGKYRHVTEKLLSKLDNLWMKEAIRAWYARGLASKKLKQEKTFGAYSLLNKTTEELETVFLKFRKILFHMTGFFFLKKISWEEIEEKCAGATNFFFIKVYENILMPLKEFYTRTKVIKGLKAFNEETFALLEDLEDYLNSLKNIRLLDTFLFDPKNEVKVSLVREKVPGKVISSRRFEQGKSIGSPERETSLMKRFFLILPAFWKKEDLILPV